MLTKLNPHAIKLSHYLCRYITLPLYNNLVILLLLEVFSYTCIPNAASINYVSSKALTALNSPACFLLGLQHPYIILKLNSGAVYTVYLLLVLAWHLQVQAHTNALSLFMMSAASANGPSNPHTLRIHKSQVSSHCGTNRWLTHCMLRPTCTCQELADRLSRGEYCLAVSGSKDSGPKGKQLFCIAPWPADCLRFLVICMRQNMRRNVHGAKCHDWFCISFQPWRVIICIVSEREREKEMQRRRTLCKFTIM